MKLFSAYFCRRVDADGRTCQQVFKTRKGKYGRSFCPECATKQILIDEERAAVSD